MTTGSAALDKALTHRYGQQLARLRTRASEVASTSWRGLGTYDETDVERWKQVMHPITQASRAAAATLTAGYLHAAHGTSRPVTVTDLRDLDPIIWRQPFMSMWASLARGEGFDAAFDVGLSRASDTAAYVITTSARDAASVVDSGAPQLTRWTRIPEANACDWCNDMATQDYGSAEDAALNDEHSNCHCEVVPA